jgi:nitrous oxidase accessory protein
MKITGFTVLIILSLGLAARAPAIEVYTTDDFIQALTDTLASDTIHLRQGIYSGPFEVTLPRVIVGESGAIIDGQGVGDALTLVADSIVLRGVTVQNSGTRLLKDHAGIKVSGDFIEISDCLVRDILHGIYVKAGDSLYIHDNTIVGRMNIQESDRGNGIHLWNTSGNILENNDIGFARDGIYFSFANLTQITGNHIHDLRYGLHYMYSDSNSFEDNLFDHNVAGAALMFSKEISFKRNIFAHCRGFRAYGILLQSVEYCTAESNLILDNTRGIFFDDANHNRFEGNDVVQNDQAILINASCEDNLLVGNNFISNLSEVVMEPSVIKLTTWDRDGRGNFWSAYDGYDIDGDGVGDVPFQLQSIFEFLELDNPAVRFYLYSPAAQLLAMAEKRLPILRKETASDPKPIFRTVTNADVPWHKLVYSDVGASVGHCAIWALALLLPPVLTWKVRK